MKKLLVLFTAIAFAFALTACGGNDNPDNPDNPDLPDETDAFWDKDDNGIPDWQEEEVTISYATWQHTNPDGVTVDSLMVEAFMEKYPNITVEMDIVAEWDQWDTAMLARLETDDIPDVFLLQRVPNMLDSHMLYDVTDMYDNDPDTEYIFDSVQNLGVYPDGRYAVPTFYYPQLWIVNLDILDARGITAPGYDWTVDQMEAIITGAKDDTNHYLGMHGCDFYTSEYPKILKGDNLWQAFGYDGDKFNFTDPVFQEAINAQSEIINSGACVTGLEYDEKEAWYGDPDFNPMYGGKTAVWREPSWSVKDYFDVMDFNWDAYPGPGGVTGGNIDLAGIAATTDHPEASYQLLKWMTFGEDGLLTRFELFDTELAAQGNNYSYPIVDYGIDTTGVNQVWSNIPYGDVAPGLVSIEMINGIRNGAVWANKSVIGWDDVSDNTAEYFTQIRNGESDFASLKETIQDTAEQAIENARQALGY